MFDFCSYWFDLRICCSPRAPELCSIIQFIYGQVCWHVGDRKRSYQAPTLIIGTIQASRPMAVLKETISFTTAVIFFTAKRNKARLAGQTCPRRSFLNIQTKILKLCHHQHLPLQPIKQNLTLYKQRHRPWRPMPSADGFPRPMMW